MSDEQARTDANDRERSPEQQYSLSIDQVAELYAQAGHPRTLRAIQKYCAVDKLDCHKVETDTGEKYLVAPYSVQRHIAYINEVRTVATSRDQTRTDANVRPLENKAEMSAPPGDEQQRTSTNSSEQQRTVANIRALDERYVTRLEGEVEFLRAEISTKNAQIKELTERSRETNVLIAGLQKMLTPLLGGTGERRDTSDTTGPQF